MPKLVVRNSHRLRNGRSRALLRARSSRARRKKDKIISVEIDEDGRRPRDRVCGSCAYPRERGACEGKSIVLMLPHPRRLTLRRLARLFEHEVKHNLGLSHEQMNEDEYWSRGQLPQWARGCIIQWHPPGKRPVVPFVRLRSPRAEQGLDAEGRLLERELAKLPERSPTRPRR